MTMLSFVVPALALLLALLGSVALVHQTQPGIDDRPRSFRANCHDHWVQVP